MQRKIFRAAALGLTCLATLVSLPASAQGLRLPGGSGAAPLRGMPPASQAAQPASGVRQADFIVAVVNSEPITNNEVMARLNSVLPQFAGRPNAPSPAMLAREVLEQLIIERTQLQEAKQMGLTVDDFVVERAEQSVAAQNGVTMEGLHQRLASDGVSVASFRQDLRNQLLLQRVRERAGDTRNLTVSESEVEAYLREIQQQADGPENLNIAHILVAVPEGAGAAEVQRLQQRAEQIAARARAGEDFATLAREASAADAQQGRGMGLRPVARYPDLFVEAVGSGGTGTVAGPVRSGAGFHVLKVVEREKAVGTVQQTHARHILLRTGASLSEREAVARLTELRRRIVGGHLSFALAAQEHSHDASAADGGDLGWATPGRYVPEFEQAMNALQPGEVSEPLVSRFGVHLIEVIERRQVQPSPRELREGAREAVRERKREEAFARWAQDLRGRAYVEYREPPQ